jgi:amidohydrolase
MQIPQEILNDLVVKAKAYREHIHQFPELSFEEKNTMEFVAKSLEKIGIPFTKHFSGTGVVGIIRGDHHAEGQPCIGLRSELDALPILEQTERTFRSTVDGVMHACGHDVHTAIHLATAEYLWSVRNSLQHPVKLIFQPGEEKNPGGASIMVADGVLKNPEVKCMTALHVFPEMEAGKVGFREGLYMASSDEVYITINGKGGHGAMPHQTIDPIMIGAHLLTGLQQVVSRKCDPKIPCVLTFGHFEALGATNVIPDKAILKGTFRTMDETWREEALKKIVSHVNHTCEEFGATADVKISKGYPMLFNDTELTRKMKTACISELGAENVEELPIRLTSEDFAFYSQEIPTCFYRLGVGNKEKGITFGVHHPRFDVDDRCFEIGIRTLSKAAFLE